MGRVTALSRRHYQGQHLLALFTSQVDLGGQLTAGASQRVVFRFDRQATGRLLLLAEVSAGRRRRAGALRSAFRRRHLSFCDIFLVIFSHTPIPAGGRPWANELIADLGQQRASVGER
jgi:hypothetical protein